MMNRENTTREEEFIHPARFKREEEELYLASQWQLMWWKFKEHKAAMASAIVIILLYIIAIFAEFFAPFDPMRRAPKYIQAPPQKIHFIDKEGFHLRPFVYDMKGTIDRDTMTRVYEIDKSYRYRVYFFVRGDEYKLWNLFKCDLHLFGTKQGTALYLFGTDGLGRDMLSRIIYGARISLSIGLVGVFLSLILGLILGGIAGYFGGVVDSAIQRLSEVVRSFPTIPLWLGLSAALPPDWPPLRIYFGITVILSLSGWTGLARQARGKILSLKTEDFVLAARFSGASTARVIGAHLIPSFMSHIIATLTLAIPYMILGETALSFLGIGLRDPVVSWGVLLQRAQNIHTIANNPWLLLPGVCVIVTILCFNFVGDGLRDAADPYSR